MNLLREYIRGLLTEQASSEADHLARLVKAGHGDHALELMKTLPEIDPASAIARSKPNCSNSTRFAASSVSQISPPTVAIIHSLDELIPGQLHS